MDSEVATASVVGTAQYDVPIWPIKRLTRAHGGGDARESVADDPMIDERDGRQDSSDFGRSNFKVQTFPIKL